MIVRAASGWQTVTADLALILFLITAQAAGSEPAPQVQEQASDAEQATPASSALAVHRPAKGETVREWLLATVTDERQVATISVNYAAGRRTEALTEAERLLGEADAAGIPTRLIAIPNAADDIVISVDYLRTPTDGTNLAK